MEEYKLYATKMGEIPEGVEFSLRPCNTNYLLVFTDKKLGKPFVEIPPETELTEQERQFVARCKFEVNKRAIKQNEESYLDFMNRICDSLEIALAEEKKNNGESNT